MGRGAAIVRLIDVVLILLFGFISISRIHSHAGVDLASTDSADLAPPSVLKIYIGVSRNGAYMTPDGEVVSVDSLKRYLMQERAQRQAEFGAARAELLVQIYADSSAEFGAIDAARGVCDSLALRKQVVLTRRPSQ